LLQVLLLLQFQLQVLQELLLQVLLQVLLLLASWCKQKRSQLLRIMP
jgi:hypothetical protein